MKPKIRVQINRNTYLEFDGNTPKLAIRARVKAFKEALERKYYHKREIHI